MEALLLLEINARQAGLEQDTVQRIERLLDFSLERFRRVLIRVMVRFYDVNGPKGGVDKRYCITARLHASGHGIVRSQGTD